MRGALLIFAGLALIGTTPARAQDWITSAFPDRQHDFGTVARGSKVSHKFRIVNTTNQEIRILDWKTKCGCTEVRVGSREIPPGTQTSVEAVLDTTRFQGFKASGLTLVLDRPMYLQVDLNLSCFIRGDVVLEPGGIDFGVVGHGAKPTVNLMLNYAGGMPDWKIVGSEHNNPVLKAKVIPVGHSGGSARYQITATLDPSELTGGFRDEITLKTNDPSSPTIPISVAATVQSNVSVAPSPLVLGRVRAGGVVKKTVLVRSDRPFKLTGATAERGEIAAEVPAAAGPVHALTVTITAPDKPGPYTAVLEIATDVQGEPPLKLSAFANVVR